MVGNTAPQQSPKLRFEYKFIVPIYQLDKLRSYILPFMELDSYARSRPDGEYTVRSIYFDTPGLQCYIDKKAGVKRRNKVRLRGYNQDGDEGTVFFEIKKKVDDPLFKNRASLSYREARQVLKGAALEPFFNDRLKGETAQDNLRRFLYHVHARQMLPVVTVIYEREPYQSILRDRDNRLRITFDKQLRAVAYPSLGGLFREEEARLVDPQHFIMEVKFNHYFPSWLKPILRAMGLNKEPASKYALSIERLGLWKVRKWN
jgi:hypothetical protein